MADMFDYLDWFGDFDFDVVPFNEVDNLILSQLAYAKFDGALGPDELLPTGEAQRRFVQANTVRHEPEPGQDGDATETVELPDLGPLISPLTNDLLGRLATAGRRFATAEVGYYTSIFSEERREQFCALSVALSDGSTYVAFRGTDDSVVGWIEDCDLSYRVTPSQTDALAYLRRVAQLTTGPLRVGGHSKGGNLAAYAAALAPELDDRIVELWCNDSPGFDDDVVALSHFERLRGRTRLFTPGFGVVSSMLTNVFPAEVVMSCETGIMEHSAMSWQVMRGSLVRAEQAQPGSITMGDGFRQLTADLDLEGRRDLTDKLFEATVGGGLHTLADLSDPTKFDVRTLTGLFSSLDDDKRKALGDFLRSVAGGAVRGAADDTAARATKALMPLAHSISSALSDLGRRVS